MSMLVFIIALLLFLAALISIGAALMSGNKGPAVGLAVALFIVGGLTLFFDSYTTVSARTVGVETSFGKPVSALSNGFHWVRPWASVDDSWDGTLQTTVYNPTVRLGNGTTAQVDVSVQYQIDTNAQFLSLWRNYKTFDLIKSNLIQRQTTTALNEVFETYNPLTTLDDQGNQTIQVSSFAGPVAAKLAAAMPAGVTVKNVSIPLITYNPQVQSQINSIIAAAAATRVAKQNEQTATDQAAANDTLSHGSTSAGVLYQQCLTMTQSALKAGETLPPGWSCGTPAASVVIPTK
jgi:hypothetical protein